MTGSVIDKIKELTKQSNSIERLLMLLRQSNIGYEVCPLDRCKGFNDCLTRKCHQITVFDKGQSIFITYTGNSFIVEG